MSQSPAEVTSLAYHWIVQRPNGAGFAATSHDQGQQIGSTTFEPNMDLRPAELTLTDEMFGSSLELEGGLSSRALAVADLRAERWSGASVQLLAGDWQKQVEPIPICEGELGRVSLNDGRAAMAVDLLPAAVRNQPCVQTSPECRAILGDRQCRVDMRSRRKRVQVTDAVANGVTVDLEDAQEFVMGRLRWTTGVNCGFSRSSWPSREQHCCCTTPHARRRRSAIRRF
jgi:uncharacterized phage protein (TIGR02218 family)